MKLGWSDLTVSMDGMDLDAVLSDWRWLIGDDARPVLMSAAGDLFVQKADGSVWWLDAGGGSFKAVAHGETFQQEVAKNANEWLLPQMIGDLKGSGVELAPGQVYGFKTAPILGGAYKLQNIEPTDAVVHFSLLGQIHEQVKDLPEGTPIGDLQIR